MLFGLLDMRPGAITIIETFDRRKDAEAAAKGYPKNSVAVVRLPKD